MGKSIRWSTTGLMRLCRPLLDGDLGTDAWNARVLSARFEEDDLTGPHATDLLLAAAGCFRATGELREELLPLLWEPLGLHRDEYGNVLLLLCKSGLLFLAEHTEHGRRWVMPLRLPEAPPRHAIERWVGAQEVPKVETLTLVYSLGVTPPAGLVERLMAACYGVGKYKACWKRGAVVETSAYAGGRTRTRSYRCFAP